MEKLQFRLLRADEIDCRIATVKESGITLLLYKDARVDQNILDETVGPMNWQRRHCRENANCIVSLWDSEKKQWIEKEDTGTESYTEKEKGLASDSFKRACFNWGIGRELYTAPFIWIGDRGCKIVTKKTGSKETYTCYDKFSISQIGYDDEGKINALEICNDRTCKVVYHMGAGPKAEPVEEPAEKRDVLTEAQINTLLKELARTGIGWRSVCASYKVEQFSHMSAGQFKDAMKVLREKPDKPVMKKEPDPTTVPPDDDCGLPWN